MNKEIEALCFHFNDYSFDLCRFAFFMSNLCTCVCVECHLLCGNRPAASCLGFYQQSIYIFLSSCPVLFKIRDETGFQFVFDFLLIDIFLNFISISKIGEDQSFRDFTLQKVTK